MKYTILQAMKTLESDALLVEHVDSLLVEWQTEPLISKMFETPQSPRFHGEGPTVRAHIRRILIGLFGILEGKVRLLELDELARAKELRDDIEEMEQTVKEHGATFQVFALMHDIGKPARMFTGDDGQIHYHKHEKEIFRPDVQDLLGRMATSFRLEPHDLAMVVEMISMHMEPLRRFRRGPSPNAIDLFTKHADKRALDGDDFLDMLEAGVLLDQVLGSVQLVNGSQKIHPAHLLSFLHAKHDHAPWKRERRHDGRRAVRKQQEQEIFHSVGLDGESVMHLTGMKPGKELGLLLQAMQQVAKRERADVEIPAAYKQELAMRVQMAEKKIAALD